MPSPLHTLPDFSGHGRLVKCLVQAGKGWGELFESFAIEHPSVLPIPPLHGTWLAVGSECCFTTSPMGELEP